MSIFITIGFLLLVPAVIYAANKKLYSGKLRNYFISFASAFLVYSFIIGSVVYAEKKLDNELAAFDLNNDGLFSGIEITPEQERAMLRVSRHRKNLCTHNRRNFLGVLFFNLWLVLTIFSWAGERYAGKST